MVTSEYDSNQKDMHTWLKTNGDVFTSHIQESFSLILVEADDVESELTVFSVAKQPTVAVAIRAVVPVLAANCKSTLRIS